MACAGVFFGGDNSFSVTLRDDGAVEISYGNVDSPDGIAGVTEGDGAVDPGPSDLSGSATWLVSGTTYEEFTFPDSPVDLEGTTIAFQ